MNPPAAGVDLVRKRVEERTALADADAPSCIEADASAAEADANPAKPRWVTPLIEFIGTEEPEYDDSEDWIIRDFIPRGEPALLVGPAKSGKTWALLDLAIAVATGRHWLDGAQENTLGRPGRVQAVVLEDSPRRLKKRLWELCRARGIRPNEDPVLAAHLSITRAPLRLPDSRDERAFAAELKRWKPDVVLIDNLTRVMVGDQNKPEPAALFTKLWIQLCTDIGAAIVFLHHTGKLGDWKPGMSTRDAFDLIRGSSDFLAAARNAVVMFPIRAGDDEDTSGLQMSDVRIRGNLDLRRESLVLGFERTQGEAGRWSAQLRDCGEVSKVRAEIVARHKEAAAAKRKEEAAAENHRRRGIALDIIRREGSCSNADLATALGLKSAQSAAPILRAMLADGLVVHDSRRGYMFPDLDKGGTE